MSHYLRSTRPLTLIQQRLRSNMKALLLLTAFTPTARSLILEFPNGALQSRVKRGSGASPLTLAPDGYLRCLHGERSTLVATRTDLIKRCGWKGRESSFSSRVLATFPATGCICCWEPKPRRRVPCFQAARIGHPCCIGL